MRLAARRIATAALTLGALWAVPASALAVEAADPAAPTVPAPAAGTCVHPSLDDGPNVVYRWRSRANYWRARPVATNTVVRRSPSVRAGRVGALAAITETARQTAWYLVLDARQIGGACWFSVRLPADPNDRSGWVLRDELVVERSGWQIEIDLSERRVRAYSGGRARFNARSVIGTNATPTPVSGTSKPFALYDAVRGRANAFTGSWQIATTAYGSYSRSLGRIGLHGRGGASLDDALGTASSNGCIRLTNSDVSLLVRRIGLDRLAGVPVLVVA